MELLTGIAPLRADPDRRSGFVCSLARGLYYASDGRPFEELMAASGLAFGLHVPQDPAGSVDPNELEAAADVGLEVVSRVTGTRLRYLELGSLALALDEPQRAWGLLREEVRGALDGRQPVLARGGWPGEAGRWGLITGTDDDSGLPLGHVCAPPEQPPIAGVPRPVTMSGSPWQLVLIENDMPRPSARESTRLVVELGASALRGEPAELVRVGARYHSGPAAWQAWAERVGSGQLTEAEARAWQRELADRRRWGQRYLADLAAVRLGRLRELRALAARWREALAPVCGPPEGPAPALTPEVLSAAGEAERALGGELEAAVS